MVQMLQINYNFLLTERNDLTEECWPELVAYKNNRGPILPSMAQASGVRM